MNSKQKSLFPARGFPSFSLQRNISRPILSMVLTCCLAIPAVALANTLKPLQDGVFSNPITLKQWPENQIAPIPQLEQLGDQRIQALIEEAAKQAQANYLAAKFRQNPKSLREYVDLAWAEAAKRDGIEPELLIAIMQKESGFRPKVQSRYGAQGLMQVVRRWHREKLHSSESLFDPKVNVRVGTDVLEEYLESANGSLPKALRKYSGNARGYTNKILKESRKLAQLADQANLNATMAQASAAAEAG
ncbi:lytic transglycosylase domain-containing protein [Pusillimonas sp. MFBS29]|uniref:transglycosylase SLT domain-containing protein n=1 Tax=Pusillimonas sp. MFBS29 TaxID=2886690 RepID=UPI001D1089D9|nr:lytic transglycosylase domain-containing protein [Pusillimonas sp. MFBS29]MCC2597218.1 lytic transglycosylase domain-containing protein [Pusillimonas sp. MFBS29]